MKFCGRCRSPETGLVLDILNLPTEPIVSSAGVVNTQVGMWRGLGRGDAARITSSPRPTCR